MARGRERAYAAGKRNRNKLTVDRIKLATVSPAPRNVLLMTI